MLRRLRIYNNLPSELSPLRKVFSHAVVSADDRPVLDHDGRAFYSFSSAILALEQHSANMAQTPSSLGSQACPCHIVIIGGGLAGLATALGLRKGGHSVTVLERVTEFSKVGRECFRA